jgi:hypothetical protein
MWDVSIKMSFLQKQTKKHGKQTKEHVNQKVKHRDQTEMSKTLTVKVKRKESIAYLIFLKHRRRFKNFCCLHLRFTLS